MLSGKSQGALRPVVKSAWALHCGQIGEDAKNVLAYRSWYEGVLLSAAGIRSTRDASDGMLDTLLDAFRVLGGEDAAAGAAAATGPRAGAAAGTGPGAGAAAGTEPMAGLALSEGQLRVFRRLFAKAVGKAGQAAAEEALNEVVPGAPQETFDRIMAHLAVLAMDEFWMDRTSAAAERRVHYLIRQALMDISELTGTVHDWEYARGVYDRMKLPLRLEDVPAALGVKVFQALDVYRRRLVGRRCAAPEATDDIPF